MKSGLALFWLVLLICNQALSRTKGEESTFYLMLGQLETEPEVVTIETGDTALAETSEFPTSIPYGGGAVQRPVYKGNLEYGWEGGMFLGWKSEVTRFEVVSDGGLRSTVEIRSDLLLLDTFLGLYTALNAGEYLRLFISGGPSITQGIVTLDNGEDDNEEDGRTVIISTGNTHIRLDNDDDYAAALGYYGHAGITLKVNNKVSLGLSARYVDSKLNFSDTFGEVTLKGTQYFFTVSSRF